MNRQQQLSLLAMGLSLAAIFDLTYIAAVGFETVVESAVWSTSPAGIYVTTGYGDSMEPTMEDGARALCVEHVEANVGDVVAVEGEAVGSSHDLRHRVVERNETHVWTFGDGNDDPDDPAPIDAIRCTVVWVEGAGLSP